MEPDFSGYATKAGLKCSDGRTIMPEAFKHMDGVTVPLVWQHGHKDPANVLGHAVLESRDDGVYAKAYFNSTPGAQAAKQLVQHEDIKSLSIYANQLVEKAKQVFHGVIREVSLVLSGANPGALIDHIAIQHSDGEVEELDDEAIIYTGLELQHGEESDDDNQNGSEEEIEHESDDEKTVKDVYETLSDDQKNVVHYMIGQALQAAGAKSVEQSSTSTDEGDLEHKEGSTQMTNVFETKGENGGDTGTHELTHDAIKGIFADAQERGSLKEAVKHYALQHGITDIDMLFPEARDVGGAAPDWVKRRTEWVSGVINGVRPNPFTRIRTRTADITFDDARALGYIKGNLKKEEWFGLSQRTTGPTTVYKKQKLDRDDILDITDFDVVSWLKAEMRLMLEEEIARAILVGDGRPTEDPASPGNPNPDKIRDPAGAVDGTGIRSILNDHDLYVHEVTVDVPATPGTDYEVVVEAVARARRFYKGSGSPTLYTTEEIKTEMLLSKDNDDRRRYRTDAELASALRVSNVVAVEAMESVTTGTGANLLGIIVNLSDYTVGTDKGGAIANFDDFDIDYNQYKYLMETRLSGALTKVKSAMVLRRTTPLA